MFISIFVFSYNQQIYQNYFFDPAVTAGAVFHGHVALLYLIELNDLFKTGFDKCTRVNIFPGIKCSTFMELACRISEIKNKSQNISFIIQNKF